jgi:cation-transporting ATPase E
MSEARPTNPEFGLTTAEVNDRLAAGATNTQQLDSSRSLASIIRGNVVNLFNGVVGGCFILLAVLGQWKDTLFGFALISNLLIGIVQEYSAKRTLDRLAVLNQPLARVRRNGEEITIPRELVVLDDIVVLRAGDQILADGEVVETSGLEIDESLLTGESDPIDGVIGHRALSGCGVIAGSGLMRVTAVGANTYALGITAEARKFTLVNSELRNALARLIKWVTWVLIPLTVILVVGQIRTIGGWGSATNTDRIDVVVRSASSIVAMIPQGLVLITSIAFALAAVTLTRRRVLLQELPAVEGLARVDTLCTDKTGTLTDGGIDFDAIHPIGEASESAIAEVLGFVASDSAANATALALVDRVPTPTTAPTARVPFSSARKWSAVSVGSTTWVFGAPEFVLDESGAHHRDALDRAASLAEAGLRTLVLASTTKPVAADSPLPRNLTPVALVTFTERVRDDARQTLEYFRKQGVRVLIISGDNPATVSAIANRAGLHDGDALDARTLPTDQAALAAILEEHSVFGRVTPEQKRTMMAALQSRGHVVAMIGDGVNDALALKHADLGIAMGSGAAATKAVSNLVLLDGRFSSLPGVVDEGRKVIANIERLSRLFLTKTVWAMLLAAYFGIAAVSFPFLPRQLSAVDMFTIGVPSFLLALLPNSRRYVPGFLGRALAFCVPAGVITAGAVLTLTAIIQTQTDWVGSQSQTATTLLLAMTGLWVLTSLSRPISASRVGILALMVVIGIAVYTIPLVAEFCGFTPLTGSQFGETLGLGLAANALITLVALIVDRRNRAATATVDTERYTGE